MNEVWIFLIVVGLWVLLQAVVLPGLGVDT